MYLFSIICIYYPMIIISNLCWMFGVINFRAETWRVAHGCFDRAFVYVIQGMSFTESIDYSLFNGSGHYW